MITGTNLSRIVAHENAQIPDIRQLLVNRKSASRTASWSSVSFAMSPRRISPHYLTHAENSARVDKAAYQSLFENEPTCARRMI